MEKQDYITYNMFEMFHLDQYFKYAYTFKTTIQ